MNKISAGGVITAASVVCQHSQTQSFRWSTCEADGVLAPAFLHIVFSSLFIVQSNLSITYRCVCVFEEEQFCCVNKWSGLLPEGRPYSNLTYRLHFLVSLSQEISVPRLSHTHTSLYNSYWALLIVLREPFPCIISTERNQHHSQIQIIPHYRSLLNMAVDPFYFAFISA